MTRTPWQPLVGAVLLVLLAVLATLQYRWLGQVSDAEREERRASMQARAASFGQDFDREVSRAYAAFWLDPSTFDQDPAGALSDAYERARSQSAIGGIVGHVYVVDRPGRGMGSLERLDPVGRELHTANWPDSLDALRARLGRERVIVRGFSGSPMMAFSGAIDPMALALIVPVMQPPSAGASVPPLALPAPATAPIIVLELDRDRLGHTLIESLVRLHFGPLDTSDDFVTVVSRHDPSQAIYASSPDSPITPATADLALDFFTLRLGPGGEAGPGGVAAPVGAGSGQQVRARVVRRITAPEDESMALDADGQGAWQVLVRGRRGSLEAVVARSRQRNLAISLGVLGLLAASFVLLMASAQRQQHLVRQQMEFVAAMSHELRTPLAVIRSAGDNLADGLVTDGAQVKEHGALVRTEGRRLSDMVERVLVFSGISSGAPLQTRPEVDLARLLGDVTNGMTPDAADRRVTVRVGVTGPLPPVAGDPEALRSALENVVGNAIKYSPAGVTVDVEAQAVGSAIRISVTDRGPGIDDADLPHIFKPFYRGRRVVDAQVRGTGVGLSIVRRVVDAHRGDIQVTSRVGEGTTVVITLPSAPSGSRTSSGDART